MAIDTDQKRRAAGSLPLLPVSLLPDGTISQTDRAQCGWGYPGLVTTSAAGTMDWALVASEMEWTPDSDRAEWELRIEQAEWTLDSDPGEWDYPIRQMEWSADQ